MNEPLFPSRDEISKRIEIAKQLRSSYLRLPLRGARHNVVAQTPISRTLAASVAAMALVAGGFWLGVAGSGGTDSAKEKPGTYVARDTPAPRSSPPADELLIVPVLDRR